MNIYESEFRAYKASKSRPHVGLTFKAKAVKLGKAGGGWHGRPQGRFRPLFTDFSSKPWEKRLVHSITVAYRHLLATRLPGAISAGLKHSPNEWLRGGLCEPCIVARLARCDVELKGDADGST